MTIVYYVGKTKPEERTCEVFGHPNLDSTGATQYVNTHFLNIDEAWERVLAENEAWVSLSTRNLRELFKQIDAAKEAVIRATLSLQEAKENYSQHQERCVKHIESPIKGNDIDWTLQTR